MIGSLDGKITDNFNFPSVLGPLEGRCQGGIGGIRDFLEEMPVKDKREEAGEGFAGLTPAKGGDRRSLGLQHSPEEGSSRPLEGPRAC